jgi:hypothetical protein
MCTSRNVEPHVDGREGVTAELGLDNDLLRCLESGGPSVEHCVVEHRYKLLRPATYSDELLPRYGHGAQDPNGYTLSALIAKSPLESCLTWTAFVTQEAHYPAQWET